MPKETRTEHPLSTGTKREGTGLRTASRHGKTAVLQLGWAWQTQREVPFHLPLCLTSCPAHWSCLPWTPYQQQQNMSVCTSVCKPASCQRLSDERQTERAPWGLSQADCWEARGAVTTRTGGRRCCGPASLVLVWPETSQPPRWTLSHSFPRTPRKRPNQ